MNLFINVYELFWTFFLTFFVFVIIIQSFRVLIKKEKKVQVKNLAWLIVVFIVSYIYSGFYDLHFKKNSSKYFTKSMKNPSEDVLSKISTFQYANNEILNKLDTIIEIKNNAKRKSECYVIDKNDIISFEINALNSVPNLSWVKVCRDSSISYAFEIKYSPKTIEVSNETGYVFHILEYRNNGIENYYDDVLISSINIDDDFEYKIYKGFERWW